MRTTWIFVLGAALALSASTLAQTTERRGAAEIKLNRGITAFVAGDYATARDLFATAARLAPDLAAPRFMSGLTLMQIAAATSDPAERERLLREAVEQFNQSQVLDPDLTASYLDLAVAQTALGDFEKAEGSIGTFMQHNPNEPLPYLFEAILRYRIGRDDAAKRDESYARALKSLDEAEQALNRQDEPSTRVRAYIEHYRGLVYLEQALTDKARDALQRSVKADAISPAARSSEKLLEQMDAGQIGRRRPWDLTLQIGYDYDTNVSLRGEGISRNGLDERDSRFGVASAFTYRVVDSEEWLVGVGAETFNSWHFDRSDFNVQTYSGNVYAAWSPRDARWLTLGGRYDYDVSLVGNDPFLQRHRLTPQIDLAPLDWTRTTIYYQFERNFYEYPINDRRLDRDGDTHALGIIQGYDLFQLFERQVRGTLRYRFENVSTDGGEFSSENNIFGVGLEVPLPEDFTFEFASDWEWDSFKNASLFDVDRRKRQDDLNTLVFALTKRFNEQLSLRFQVDWIQVDSNVRAFGGGEPFSYDRIIYGATLQYRF